VSVKHTEEELMEWWIQRGLPRSEFTVSGAQELNDMPDKAVEELRRVEAEDEAKRETQRWILAFAIAYFIQRNGQQMIGGIGAIVGGFIGLKPS